MDDLVPAFRLEGEIHVGNDLIPIGDAHEIL